MKSANESYKSFGGDSQRQGNHDFGFKLEKSAFKSFRQEFNDTIENFYDPIQLLADEPILMN